MSNYKLHDKPTGSPLESIFTPYCHPYDKALVLQRVQAQLTAYCKNHKVEYIEDNKLLHILGCGTVADVSVLKARGFTPVFFTTSPDGTKHVAMRLQTFNYFAQPLIEYGLRNPPKPSHRQIKPGESYVFNI
ncbi:hypothetical protein [Alloscardovia omnicolens]